MSIKLNQADRLAAMQLDEAALAILREVRPLIAQHIDAAVTAAYAHFMTFPEVQKVYAKIDMAAAKRSQREHWMDDVFATTFTEAQLARTIDLCEQRQRSGLALRWFFVFWSVILANLTEAIAPAYRKRPDRLPVILAACKCVLERMFSNQKDPMEAEVCEPKSISLRVLVSKLGLFGY